MKRTRPAARGAAVIAGSVAAFVLLVGASSAGTATVAVTRGSGSVECATSTSPGLTRLIVRLSPGASADAVAAGVDRCGGRVVAVQSSLGTLVADAPAASAPVLRALPGVRGVVEDYELHPTSLGFAPSTQPGAMTNVTRVSGATAMWKQGYTGSGVDVAIIDTGVAPVSGLKDSAKVVVGPDLSFESQDSDLRFLDTYGHGTNMAGIIAGREVAKASGTTYAADTTNFYGMAPDSRLVSLKLADRNGAVDVSQMVAAIDWVVQNRAANGLNIRVLNISYGTHSPQSPQVDPLSWAAEVAWRSGIVVVASAGNEGSSVAGLSNPAYNPWVIAVGAVDTRGTDAMSDDVVPAFSAKQGGNFGTRGLDVVAPGVGVVSLGVPGSYLSDTYPAARFGNGFLRGSGTSQAAAVVSGASALLISQRTALTPNQVKALLIRSATKLSTPTTAEQGNGELNLVNATALAVPTSTQSPVVGSGTGGIESARGGVHVVMGGQSLADERDIMGNSFVGPAMGAKAASGTAWGSDGSFNGSVWIGTGFAADTTSWAGKTWGGKTWTGKTWTGKTWTGDSWSGKTWSNSTWTGSGWASATWATPVTPQSWSGSVWTTDAWK
jgi:serine protease AprX